METRASRLLLSVTLLSLRGFRVLLSSQWKRKEKAEKHQGNAIHGRSVGEGRGEGWEWPLRDNPIVCGRVEVGVCIFCARIFLYPDDVSASVSVIFTCLPHPLYEINKDSVLLCFICPVLLISIILEPNTILGTEYVFIEYLD